MFKMIFYPIRNIVKIMFPEYFRKKNLKYINATIHSNVILHQGSQINNNSRKENIIIGENTQIEGILQVFDNCGEIKIGKNCFVGLQTRIYSAAKITIGDFVQIAHNVNIFDNNIHSLDPFERQKEFTQNTQHGFRKLFDLLEKEVVINNNVWIGTGVIILKGVVIGENSIIGAGSIVANNIPPNSIAVGNPAKVVKTIKK